ncbi:MAG: hypothetical protein ABJC60_01500 [Actinomycetota bacterium]
MPESGPIDAGTYQTKTFHPQLTYTVPAGWGNFEDLPGNFLLVLPGAPLSGVNPGTSDYLGVYTSVVAPGHCNSQASTTVPPTFDGLAGFLTSNPGISASNVHNVTVGRLKGVVMDLAFKGKGDGCPDGMWADIYVGRSPSSLSHSVIPDVNARIYLLHNGADTLAIELQDGVDGNCKDWFGAAAKVIETFKFH